MENENNVIDLEQLELILAEIKKYCERVKSTWVDPEGPSNG